MPLHSADRRRPQGHTGATARPVGRRGAGSPLAGGTKPPSPATGHCDVRTLGGSAHVGPTGMGAPYSSRPWLHRQMNAKRCPVQCAADHVAALLRNDEVTMVKLFMVIRAQHEKISEHALSLGLHRRDVRHL